jgi:hypothetical protein
MRSTMRVRLMPLVSGLLITPSTRIMRCESIVSSMISRAIAMRVLLASGLLLTIVTIITMGTISTRCEPITISKPITRS